MKILVNALSGIGDSLMFSPALRVLKENLPEATIDFLVMYESVKQLYEKNPFINHIYFIDFLRIPKIQSIKNILKIRFENYDYTINVYPSNRLEYNMLNFLLGRHSRISYTYTHSNIFRFEFLNNILIPEVKDKHNVLQNLEIVKRIIKKDDIIPDDMEIYLSENTENNAINWFNHNNITAKYIIGLHPGSSTLKNHINKRWAKDKFAQLGKILMKKYGAQILLFGNESGLNEEINALMGNQASIVKTDNFMDSMSILKKCNLFISNDTAFLHCSSAFKIPVVAIFGYTNYKELFPWNTKHSILRLPLDCSPCFYNSPKPASCKWQGDETFKCLKDISVEDVYNACQTLIEEIPDNSKP